VVRVAIQTHVAEITAGSDHRWQVRTATTAFAAGAGARWRFVHGGGRTIRILDTAGQLVAEVGGEIALHPMDRGATVWLGPRAYRGYFVMAARDGGLAVVNRLLLEDYVKGVIGNEIGRSGGDRFEALKAQAVAARSYAYLKLASRKTDPFDLHHSDRDQVYTGVSGESPAVAEAVDATAGEMVTQARTPVETLYSACCGGKTALPGEVWGAGGGRHLVSRHDRHRGRDHCAHSRHYRWRVSYETDTFMAVFATHYPRFHPTRGGSFGELRDVRIVDRGPSGRVTELEVRTTTGAFRLTNDTIRWVLRQPTGAKPGLFSTYFDVRLERRGGRVRRVHLEGRGYGHGVGMCQEGAVGMSKDGFGYHDILSHYYADTEVRRLY
jgi:stage II sporulation protein D